MPDTLRRFALGAAILVFGIWGATMMIRPELVHPFFSDGPLNPAYSGMMGAAFFGLAIISLANETGWRWLKPSRALGLAVAVIVAEAAFLMFSHSSLIITPVTSISLIAALAVAVFLIF